MLCELSVYMPVENLCPMYPKWVRTMRRGPSYIKDDIPFIQCGAFDLDTYAKSKKTNKGIILYHVNTLVVITFLVCEFSAEHWYFFFWL